MKLRQYSSELRANTKCIPRAFCFSNLKSGLDFTCRLSGKIQQEHDLTDTNFKYAGKDSFNLRVKSLTHYKNKEPRHRLKNLYYFQLIC